jgi:hypothetical protein
MTMEILETRAYAMDTVAMEDACMPRDRPNPAHELESLGVERARARPACALMVGGVALFGVGCSGEQPSMMTTVAETTSESPTTGDETSSSSDETTASGEGSTEDGGQQPPIDPMLGRWHGHYLSDQSGCGHSPYAFRPWAYLVDARPDGVDVAPAAAADLAMTCPYIDDDWVFECPTVTMPHPSAGSTYPPDTTLSHTPRGQFMSPTEVIFQIEQRTECTTRDCADQDVDCTVSPVAEATYTEGVEIDLANCATLEDQRSIESTIPAMLELVNETDGPVTATWINFAGEVAPNLIWEIEPGGSTLVGGTYLTHPYLLEDTRGNCLGIVEPIDDWGIATIRR